MRRHLQHVCLLRPVAMGVVALLHLTHPLFHAFEGGMVDVLLIQLDYWAMSMAMTPSD